MNGFSDKEDGMIIYTAVVHKVTLPSSIVNVCPQLKSKVILNGYVPGVEGVLMVLHASELSGGLGQEESIVRDELVKVT